MARANLVTRFVVVTPVVNGARYIEANLASIANQTDPDWTHYIVDGGSTDGTLEILHKACAADPRRRLVVGKDRGLYDAVFKGFERAVADGIVGPKTICAWLGSDDLLMSWAFATLRREFEESGADWIAALPTIWDSDGRQVVVQLNNWYPRRLIRAGLFNNRALGAIQQESTFFAYNLLMKLSPEAVERIRSSRYAGDFLLWREFASYAHLVAIPVTVAGFRQHGANLSTVGADMYLDEIRAFGAKLPPSWVGRMGRASYRAMASFAMVVTNRKRSLQFAANGFWSSDTTSSADQGRRRV